MLFSMYCRKQSFLKWFRKYTTSSRALPIDGTSSKKTFTNQIDRAVAISVLNKSHKQIVEALMSIAKELEQVRISV